MSLDVWWEFRVVGAEDGSFYRESLNYNTEETLLIYVLFRGRWIENFGTDTIKVDGLSASNKLIIMLHQCVFDAVMLVGGSFAGFNLVDPTLVFEEFGKPLIIILRTKPDDIAVKNALLQHFEDWRVRWGCL
jgi:endonuclease V-like protein UPF0215 family